MKQKKYKRLSKEERAIIFRLVRRRKPKKEIAEILGRDRSTIYREIKRMQDLPNNWFDPEQAHWHAKFKNRMKRAEPKLALNSMLRLYVLKRLYAKWSPEQIANRIKIDYPLDLSMRISYESIYKFIYQHSNEATRKQLIDLLPYQKAKRWGGKRRTIYMGKIPDRLTIEKRPDNISNRSEIGHWEGDLVVGKGQTSAIGTLVERKTRYTIIVPLKSRKSWHVVNRFAEAIQKMPGQALKTLTYDNGVEMTKHKHFSHRTKMTVYFANPYSSWERGTNENTNGLIRRFFPKKTDFNKISTEQLKAAERSLNTRPRKVLGYKTPMEKLQELCA